MGNQIGVLKTGLVLGLVIGVYHLCWSALVVSGWAQPVLNFIFWMHFIEPVLTIAPFSNLKAFILWGVTSGVGFVLGSVFALVWNALHKA